MRKGIIIALSCILTASCNNDENSSDAYGNFEAIDIMVSSEAAGRLLSMDIEEGQKLFAQQIVGAIDTMQLFLKKQQLYTSINALYTRKNTLNAQIRTSKVQLENLEREYNRLLALFEDGAATEKQKDDIEGNIKLVQSQIDALNVQGQTIDAEKKALLVQVDQVNDQIHRSEITNPLEGTVLQKYKYAGEIVAPGQTLYKVANLDKLILRAYISGRQLSSVEIGKPVTVRIDGELGIEEMQGTVTWVSDQAEFTPKIIQTREERVNLVYAVKVEVMNDGRLKIGMPGEIKL